MEEIQTKQRLVGAIILVLLAVILLPMFLDGKGYEAYLDNQVPAVPSALMEPRGIVPGSALDAGKKGGQRLGQAPYQSSAKAAGQQSEPTHAKLTPEHKAHEPEPAGLFASGVAGDWIVQVASFGQQTNAQALRDKLQQAGFQAEIEAVQVNNKSGYRVYAGPFSSESMAKENQRRIESKFGLQGLLKKLPQ